MRLAFALLLLLTGCGEQKRTLQLYIWNDFIHPKVIERFEEEHNCRILMDTFDSNESMVAKLIAGGGGYDVIFPSQYFVDILEGQGLLLPYDAHKISLLHNIDWEAMDRFHIPSSKSGLPYMLSTTGIGYRADRLAKPTSWTVFGDASFKGRMTLLNDIREVLGVSLLTLGFSPNSIDQREIDEAASLVIEWRENLAKFDSDYKNGIASSEFLLAQAYSGEIQQVIVESPEVDYSIPYEGSIVSADMMAIPSDAPSVDLAHAFINFLLQPDIARLNMEFTFCNPMNIPMYEALPLDQRQNTLIFPTPEEESRCFPILDVGEATAFYIEAWNRIKG